MALVLWLLACTPDDVDKLPGGDTAATTTDTGAPAVPLDWGVGDGCDGSPQGTFDDLYDGRPVLLVHGDTPDEVALGDQVTGWYADRFEDFAVKRASALTDEDRRQHLMIVGGVDGNPLLAELDGALPVRFEDDRFTFGGYRWPELGHGIALIAPNPWSADHVVVVYAGNTIWGAKALFTVFTGGEDYVVVRGRGTDQLRGGFCRSDDGWTFLPRRAEDTRAAWDAYVAGLDTVASDRNVFRYVPRGAFAADADWMPDWQEERHDAILAQLEIDDVDFPIVHYLYDDRATKAEQTGNDGNAQANSHNGEVHELYTHDVHAVGAHEAVHVLADHRIGDTQYALMGEGLAVMVDGYWGGETLDAWASAEVAAGTLPALRDLIDDFWGAGGGGDRGYGAAGHFCAWLRTTHGADVLKRLYVADDLDAAFVAELGMDAVAVEAAWRATIP